MIDCILFQARLFFYCEPEFKPIIITGFVVRWTTVLTVMIGCLLQRGILSHCMPVVTHVSLKGFVGQHPICLDCDVIECVHLQIGIFSYFKPEVTHFAISGFVGQLTTGLTVMIGCIFLQRRLLLYCKPDSSQISHRGFVE